MRFLYLILLLPLILTARPEKPNVVLILTDDLGWQDVKCYDVDEPSPMETPNMDALAKKGVMFWQGYSPAPTCAPTRCAIMSGTHPARAQKTHVVGGAPPAPHHLRGWRMMSPWYSGRMPAGEMTIARALKANGYVTGHAGKWHMAINHHAFPQPEDQGFDWTRSERGARSSMKPSRLADFATAKANDPYRLDENGFPYHQNVEDALTFMREHNQQPFFLYFATWLVHTPIHTRSKQLLDKYCKKLGVEVTDKHADKWAGKGQTNPFYCAMVEELDYYVGKIFTYLEATEDPRWPGHKLSENTYVIFTSDNGGMEGKPGEIFTDNYPLDQGKISLMEGGTRVPLIIAGPGIKKGVQSHVVVNGLDFFPTILSLTGTKQPAGKHLDGLDLKPLLHGDAADPKLVRHPDGSIRDTMVWHFPNSSALESSIRVGDYKLVRNYQHLAFPDKIPPLELYRLYDSSVTPPKRVDIEEANNLATKMPEKARELNRRLTESLTEMKASYPYWNPEAGGNLPNRSKVPKALSHKLDGNIVSMRFEEKGAKVVRANLIYTRNPGDRYEEWFRAPAVVGPNKMVKGTLPKGATHFFVNLIDENNFLVSYPKVVDAKNPSKSKVKYAERAIPVK